MAWKLLSQEVPEALAEGLHPVIRVLLEARGYTTPEEQEHFLAPDYDRDVYDPFLFSQMERVVERVKKAREQKEKVGIFGDFDADGITSSVLLRDGLEALGMDYVVYIPDKLREGHGLSSAGVDFFSQAQTTLVFTLDCGMMNHTEISSLKEHGIETIIIDHHHVPEVLPEAYAIINPKLPNEGYPFRELCGAGTTFKVVQALYTRLLPERLEQLKWVLDVVATGTVADVMPLIGENRALVKYGLLVLGKTRRLGFQALIRTGRLKIDEWNAAKAQTISFQIAPRLNAASRMAHAMLAHQLLVAQDLESAEKLAVELENLNLARRKQSDQTALLVRREAEARYGDKQFILAADADYPYGIVGLIAGRIASEFGKPTAVLTKGPEESRGSFRSVPGFSVIKALEATSDLLLKYGGHEQAAGMTIRNEHIEAFYQRFNALAEEALGERSLDAPPLTIDTEVRPAHLHSAFARALEQMAPFGEGNPEPVFLLRHMRVEDTRFVGKGEKHLKLQLVPADDPGRRFEAVFFSATDAAKALQGGDEIDLVFQIEENVWQGVARLQLRVLDVAPSRLRQASGA